MSLMIGYGTCHLCKEKLNEGDNVCIGSNEEGFLTLAHQKCAKDLLAKKDGNTD